MGGLKLIHVSGMFSLHRILNLHKVSYLLFFYSETILPFVRIPIQLRYRVSFFDMYVFPLAGRPTIDITVGHFTTFGHVAESKKKKRYND